MKYPKCGLLNQKDGDDRVCDNYETLSGIERIHFREEIYTVGTSRYCRHFEEDVFHLKDKFCFHRGTYSTDRMVIKDE